MAERAVFYVNYDRPTREWTVIMYHSNNNGASMGPYGTAKKKVDAVRKAASYAREFCQRGGYAQLLIRRKDGQFCEERTYGRDPRLTKG